MRIGIDLGTTNSLLSYHDESSGVETTELDSGGGSVLVPSVVFFEAPDSEPIVGVTALNMLTNSPHLVVEGIKEHMGTKFTREIHGERKTPQEISAVILKTMMREASINLAEPLEEAVIAVPAYFGDAQCSATREAAVLAGIKVIELVAEPRAAAMVYAIETPEKERTPYVLVYDLGGGTFDATLINSRETDEQGRMVIDNEVIAQKGNRIGGRKWDQALQEYVMEEAKKTFKLSLDQDQRSKAAILVSCEQAKKNLSMANSASVTVGTVLQQIEITRPLFEKITEGLLSETRAMVEEVLKAAASAGITKTQITTVLSGGSSKMPAVARMLEELMGKPPVRYKNIDRLVSMGAAYMAAFLKDGKAVFRPKGTAKAEVKHSGRLKSISNYSVGVQVLREGRNFNRMVIPAATEYGREFAHHLATSEDGMTEVEIILYQGPEVFEPEESLECKELLRGSIVDLPPGREAGQKVRIDLKWDESGILSGKAMDIQTGKQIELVLKRETDLQTT